VAEDGIILRWWHTYVFANGEWLLIKTHHVVVDDESDGEASDVDEVAVPEIVDDENDEEAEGEA
jgi:hypothetical protein